MAVTARSSATQTSAPTATVDTLPEEELVADPNLDWRDQAVCSSDENTSLFFPVGVTGSAAVQIEDAKAVCAGCPVRSTCLDYAITTNQEYGIWGGTSEEERRVLRRAWRAEQRAIRNRVAAERKAAREAERAAAERQAS